MDTALGLIFLMNKTHPAVKFASISVALAALLSGGCASIVHSGNRSITLSTEPAGAKATVKKLEGQVVSVQTTPCTVSLDPRRGYFKGQAYRVTFELDGYKSTEVELRPSLSGWYFGNIVFGGVIGMLAVDPVTGSMWNIEPNKIEQKLSSSQTALIKDKKGFVVVLVSELTANERAAMMKVN
jgi:hypothetical protein